jgi:hypothetical protein
LRAVLAADAAMTRNMLTMAMSTMPGPVVTIAAPGDTIRPVPGYMGAGTMMGGLGTMIGALQQGEKGQQVTMQW